MGAVRAARAKNPIATPRHGGGFNSGMDMTATARDGRRRRVLHDGALAGADAYDNPQADGPAVPLHRYARRDQSLSLALARRVLPTGPLAVTGCAAGLAVLATALVACDLRRAAIEGALGAPIPALNLNAQGSLARWASSACALGVAGLAALTFGLLRNRTDDLRGAYRWWGASAVLAVAASAALSTGLFGVAVATLGAVTGFQPLGGWAWGGLLALMAAAVVARPVADLAGCRSALALAGAAAAAGGCVVGASAGALPASLAGLTPVVAETGLLLATGLLVTALLAFAGHVVRQADSGAATPAKRPQAERKAPVATAVAAEPASKRPVAKTPEPDQTRAERPAETKRVPEPVAATKWVDGTDASEEEDFDDEEGGDRRRLTKAERKRLRKQRTQRDAA